MRLQTVLTVVVTLFALGASRSAAERVHAAERPKLNYDESQVPAYTLPDPLTCSDGTPVTDATVWRSKRRAELIDSFAQSIYGVTPGGRRPGMHWKVTSDDRSALGGTAEEKKITIWLTQAEDGPSLHVLLFEPMAADGGPRHPWPAFLGLSFDSLPEVESASGTKDGLQISKVIARGFATATVSYEEICPDREDGLDKGIGRLFGAKPMNERRGDEWGAIGQWAWGLSRVMDYLVTDPSIDSGHIAVYGHSRLGKAALWAAAQDERFSLVISNESGCAGAKASRRLYGQTLEDITIAFPHWFCRDVVRFRKEPGLLPIDQHELLALAAPRPLYVASALGDQQSDPKGEFLSLKAVEPVYRLFGLSGPSEASLPPANTPVHGSALGYHMRTGKHDILPYDWDQYLDFASRHLQAPKT
jgi:hypothetical protein